MNSEVTKRRGKKYTVAIIGAGWCGVSSQLDELRVKPVSHAEAVTALGRRATLSAFVDNDRKALELCKRLYPQVPVFIDVETMFKTHIPDIAIIATHPDTHTSYIELFSKKMVRAILCEKPISHDIKAAERAVILAENYKVPLFINHIRRFDPPLRRFKDYVNQTYVRNTYLGKIRSGIAYYNKGLYHEGTHTIDFLRFFLGEIVWVSAVRRENTTIRNDLAVDCLFGFTNGIVCALQYFDAASYVLSEASFFGETGRIDFKHSLGLIVEVMGTRSYRDVSAYRELDYDNKKTFDERRSYFRPVLPHILDCLEGKDKPVSTGRDALQVLRVIKAAEKSSRQNGKKINILL